MKLYLGLKQEFEHLDPDTASVHQKGWRQLLRIRQRGDFKYPEHLNPIVLRLASIEPVAIRTFTDKKEKALTYAKTKGGILVQIDVPVEDIQRYFTLGFINYRDRKKNFEISYKISGADLAAHAAEWGLFVTKLP
ncbi:MAG: hypothetical protein WCO52_01860 [bacterium]